MGCFLFKNDLTEAVNGVFDEFCTFDGTYGAIHSVLWFTFNGFDWLYGTFGFMVDVDGFDWFHGTFGTCKKSMICKCNK